MLSGRVMMRLALLALFLAACDSGGTPDAATPDAATPDAATPDAAEPYYHCEELRWCEDGEVFQEYNGGIGGCIPDGCFDGFADAGAVYQCPNGCLITDAGTPDCQRRDDSPDIPPFGPPSELCAP
jgi:hypothetical protein